MNRRTEYYKEQWQKLKADPERYKIALEQHKYWATKRRERLGIIPTLVRRRAIADNIMATCDQILSKRTGA